MQDPNFTTRTGTICLSLLIFLFVQDVCSPPAELPQAGPLETDRLGNFSISVFIWNRCSNLEQTLLSILMTIPFVFQWRLALLMGKKKEQEQEKNQVGNVQESFVSWNTTSTAVATIVGLCGYTLRQWSEKTLAELFTYQISKPTHIVTSGPYRFLVHPGYSGGLIHVMALITLFIAPLGHRGKWTYLKVPIIILSIAFATTLILDRIEVEEIMLSEHFGEQWTTHVNDKWRILPYIY